MLTNSWPLELFRMGQLRKMSHTVTLESGFNISDFLILYVNLHLSLTLSKLADKPSF